MSVCMKVSGVCPHALNHGKHGIAASETEETYLEKCVKQQQKQYNAAHIIPVV